MKMTEIERLTFEATKNKRIQPFKKERRLTWNDLGIEGV